MTSLPQQISALAEEAKARGNSRVCALFIDEVMFGGPRLRSDGIATSFVQRGRNKSFASPYHRGLNVMALDGSGIYSEPHRPVCRHGSTSAVFHVSQMRFNHYVDAFRPRCESCSVQDDSMLAHFD